MLFVWASRLSPGLWPGFEARHALLRGAEAPGRSPGLKWGMEDMVMSGLEVAVAWCGFQVTIVAAAALGALCGWRRGDPRAALRPPQRRQPPSPSSHSLLRPPFRCGR